MLGGGAISWASKKQTCITGSTMESEFVALAAAGKEAQWLRNLIHEIPIWPKPIAPISIRYDSAPTMAKAYSQIYNGKSRHLGVRHSMVIDKSIHTGYIQAIRSAQHVIYIENQYFIVSSYAWPDYKDAGIDASDCAMEAQTLSKNRARKCKKRNWIHTGHVYSAVGVRAGAKSASIAAVASVALTMRRAHLLQRSEWKLQYWNGRNDGKKLMADRIVKYSMRRKPTVVYYNSWKGGGLIVVAYKAKKNRFNERTERKRSDSFHRRVRSCAGAVVYHFMEWFGAEVDDETAMSLWHPNLKLLLVTLGDQGTSRMVVIKKLPSLQHASSSLQHASSSLQK
ncbi:zinc finger, CCHC-type containing protein [Tanacetum coccineum]